MTITFRASPALNRSLRCGRGVKVGLGGGLYSFVCKISGLTVTL